MFDGFYINHVSRLQNTKADALLVLTATLALPVDTTYHHGGYSSSLLSEVRFRG